MRTAGNFGKFLQVDRNPGQLRPELRLVLPGANREHLRAFQKVQLTRLQVIENMRQRETDSLMISFVDHDCVLSELDRELSTRGDSTDVSSENQSASKAEGREASPTPKLSQRIQKLITQLFSLHLIIKDENQKNFHSFLSTETRSSNGSQSRSDPSLSPCLVEEVTLENREDDFRKLRNIEQKYSKVGPRFWLFLCGFCKFEI